MTVGCALVGIAQYLVGELFFNPELCDANELHVYFRVNSIFFDPNIFGRYLALALTAFAACIAWGGERRDLLGRRGGLRRRAGGARLQLLADQLRRPARRARDGLPCCAGAGAGSPAFAALGAVALVALVVAGGTPTSDIEDVRSIDSGHTDLARGGLILFGVIGPDAPPADQDVGKPIAGYGSGSFGRAFFEHIEQARTTVSHSEPVTVAAEQGVIGLTLYVALLVVSLVCAARRRGPPTRWREPRSQPASSRCSSPASATRGSRSTRRCGRCWRSGSRFAGSARASANIGGTSRLNDAGSRLRPPASAS